MSLIEKSVDSQNFVVLAFEIGLYLGDMEGTKMVSALVINEKSSNAGITFPQQIIKHLSTFFLPIFIEKSWSLGFETLVFDSNPTQKRKTASFPYRSFHLFLYSPL